MNSVKVTLALLLTPAAAGILSLVGGCSSAPENTNEQITISEEGQQKVKQLERDYPDLTNLVESSYGYAVFPSIAKGGIGIGAASGKGSVYQQGKYVGTAHLTKVEIGAILGGETYAELIVFKDEAAMTDFKGNKLKFAAGASAVALKAGAAKDAKFSNGVAVFTVTNGGLGFDASIGGQQFTYTAGSMAPTTSPSSGM